ncbi:MAG: UDP-N-acetylmuramoyl-L-alanine--D-glutamate ligase [Solobacterium sp.]|nr:UDP-N-acetylmuramoyl-L-alanine--D-glutamate ligase [Solobacterium sp.]
MNREAWKAEFEGKKILIWGFGREGQSSLKWIRDLLPDQAIDIADSGSSEALTNAEALPNVRVYKEAHTDFSSYDVILKSPGIVIPEGMDRTNITQQSQLFLKHQGFQTIGITGTKGKSTTTSLTACVLSEKYTTHLVGNIGIPCFDVLPKLKDEDLAAFEISCHQLEYSPYSPHTAVYLNLYEEHLDHYGSFQAYGDAKANIFRHQKEGDIRILSGELPYVSECDDAYLIGRDISGDEHTLRFGDRTMPTPHTKLLGAHNFMNLSIVYAIACLYGLSDEEFARGAGKFEPLHHRLELIGEHHGIRYVNDSISTIGQTAIAALNALPDTDVILIGGMDRGIEYQELEDYLASRPDLWTVFMYGTGKRIFEELKQANRTHDHMCFEPDLAHAVKTASKLCRSGHIVLLSPAASSYDAFKNFEHRGTVFEELVKAL